MMVWGIDFDHRNMCSINLNLWFEGIPRDLQEFVRIHMDLGILHSRVSDQYLQVFWIVLTFHKQVNQVSIRIHENLHGFFRRDAWFLWGCTVMHENSWGFMRNCMDLQRCSWICRDLWELVRIHGILEDSMGFVGMHMDLWDLYGFTVIHSD